MIEHILSTGTSGTMKIVDKTDEENRSVQFWLKSVTPIAVLQLPWRITQDAIEGSWQAYNFQAVTTWQKLSETFFGSGVSRTTVKFHLGATGYAELGGPSTLEVETLESMATIDILVGGVWKKAQPYVRDGGVWKLSIPFAKRKGTWVNTS